MPGQILLLDVGNTNTHVALASTVRILKRSEFPSRLWSGSRAPAPLGAFVAGRSVTAVSYSIVVPAVLPALRRFIRERKYDSAQLTAQSVTGLVFKYRKLSTLGADRVARVLAAIRLHGSPVVCVAFGTALTVEVVNGKGQFIGGIIAPGIGAFREYLYQKTAQLPKISLRPVSRFIGRGTEEAMRIGCLAGFQGMVSELLRGVRRELRCDALVVATGGYAKALAPTIPEISAVNPDLTLEGLRLFWTERG